jgi:hypothetical protein
MLIETNVSQHNSQARVATHWDFQKVGQDKTNTKVHSKIKKQPASHFPR